MKNKKLFIILVIFVLLLLILLAISYKAATPQLQILDEQTAIETIKSQYTNLKDYPGNQLAPKSVKTEKSGDGWYVAFIQEGSGRPIISAMCFFIDAQKNITSIGQYVPKLNDNSLQDFSAKNCLPIESEKLTNKKCQVENCHGLDIVCGADKPDFCTAVYELGDKCLQYAECGVQDENCKFIENDSFKQCKACAQKCSTAYEGDIVKAFECESKCK